MIDRLAQRKFKFVMAALAIVAIGSTAVVSYGDHSAVRQRALKLLEASLDGKSAPSQTAPTVAGSHASTGGLGMSTPLGSSASPGSVAQDQSPSLSIGTIVANSPPLAVGSESPGTGVSDSVPTTIAPPTPKSISVAVLTPLLSVSQFGASVGFLLACNTAAGSLSAAASQVPGLSKVLTPVISEISPECSRLSAEAVSNLNILNSQLSVLQGLTPDTQPFFAAADSVFATLGVLTPELEPLTGVITSLGPLVDFFSGQPQGS